ncbi:MAG: hypothetical protein PHC34_14100, partial [Candidatus Gastranaerophilales bacterium]|nr:hypothetical protein [Candidatus Gastranaerophilales bacterium]
CIAHECKKGNMHLNIDEILVEFADITENSEIKKMILTPLYIYGMPLLRYNIQDAAIPIMKKCNCGLPYPVIELKVGRITGNILSPDGKIVSGITLTWYFGDATQNIKQYQIIQENISDFTIKIVSNEEFRAENEEKIRNLLIEMINSTDINLKFEYCDEIPLCTNGKYRSVISKAMEEFHHKSPLILKF